MKKRKLKHEIRKDGVHEQSPKVLGVECELQPQSSDNGDYGVDFCASEWQRCVASNIKSVPHCDHGPLLLFERFFADSPPRKFWACAAYRDRKGCPAFCWEDNRKWSPPDSIHLAWRMSGEPATELVTRDLNGSAPSSVLPSLTIDKANAQYLFSDTATDFLINVIIKAGARNVLCIGTPKLHDHIQLRHDDGKKPPLDSFLLDMDSRYGKFYGPDKFCRFNMFNHHFWGDHTAALKFIRERCDFVISDPPFGGVLDALACTVSTIFNASGKVDSECAAERKGEVSFILIIPYFLEKSVVTAFPTLKITDYAVNYENHGVYHNRRNSRRSAVRVFTNINLSKFVLPSSEGYKYCQHCSRYVYKLNKHCDICNICPSKDGRQYVHCYKCNTCVKPGRSHCDVCRRCQPDPHTCVTPEERLPVRCHYCRETTHRRRDCPKRLNTAISSEPLTHPRTTKAISTVAGWEIKPM